MDNKYYKVYLYGFFAILALPLITTPTLLNPTAWGRAILFRIILASLIFLFIYRIKDIDFSALKNVISYLLITYLGIIFLSTIFSLDPYFSFWGSPLRGGGFLNYALYIIFAFLMFLIIRKEDWEKILKFSILIGVLVSFIAIFQQFGLFSKIVVSYGRVPSTMGGSIFLGLYLLLLTFMAASFAIKEEAKKKKIFYFIAFLLFIYVILITGSRAAYFGLFIGFCYFVFTYPKKKRFIILSKIVFALLLILIFWGIYYINTTPELPKFLQENQLAQAIVPRLSIDLAVLNPRFSAWAISAEAIKEKPILGYGPENFSIAFDKYYNPSLLYINRAWGSWYDKAHNFLFEISVTSGIPALLIFISLLVILYYKLRKIKYSHKSAQTNANQHLIAHGIIATFFAYISASLFSFDVFSTYILFFLIVAYSIHLTSKHSKPIQKPVEISKDINPIKSIIYCLLFIILLSFIWHAGLKPLYINRDINMADHYVRTNKCDKAVELMESKVIHNSSIIDSYAKLKYIDIIGKCDQQIPGLKINSTQKAISVLKEVTEIRPYYTRAWIFLGSYTNTLIQNSQKFKITNIKELRDESNSFFEKAYELSPKHEEVFAGWIQIKLMFGNYESAKEKSNECLILNSESAYCWWSKSVSNIYLGNYEEAKKDIAIAIENKLSLDKKRIVGEILENDSEFKEDFPGWIEIHLFAESYKESLENANQCIEESDSAYCWWLKTISTIYSKNFIQSEKDIQTAIKKGFDPKHKESLGKTLIKLPEYEQVFPGWIQVNLLSKNYWQAREEANKCIELDPNSSYCWWTRGLSNIYLNNLGQAKKDIEIAIEKGLDPKYRRRLVELVETLPQYKNLVPSWAWVNLFYKDYEQARKESEEYIESSPDSSHRWWIKALSNAYLGNIEQARKDAETAIEKGYDPEYKEYFEEFLKTL